MTLSDTALRYLQAQTLDNYLALRQLIVAAPNYAPYARAEEKAQALLAQAQFQDVITALTTLMPGCFLSPGLHLLLAHAYRQLGDADAAGTETALAQAAIHGLLLTGDGSQARPYQVVHLSDEQDVLNYLGKQFIGQAMVERDGRQFDRLECADGSRFWFDINLFFVGPPAG